MTAHSRRNRRGRTEIDIATKYFEEEEEKTKALMEKKKRHYISGSPRKSSPKTNSSINSPTEKKKNKKYPKTKIKRSPPSNLSSHSYRKNVSKRQKGRIVNKKSSERKKRLKRVRSQYSQRYNI